MRIDNLRFRNAFAYGNDWKNLPIGKLTGINLISGDNGWGKTTLSRLLKIGAYFEYDGVPVGEIANEINGNCEIIIDSFSRGHYWEIHSKYSNSRLTDVTVKKDGNLQDTGKPKDTIAWIKREILTVPYPIFANLVNLSVSDFKSLLSLDAKSSRAIRDKLFSIEILNDVRDDLKIENKQVTDETAIMTVELETMVKSIADLESQISEEKLRFGLIEENQIRPDQETVAHKVLRKTTLDTDRLALVDNISQVDKLVKWYQKKDLLIAQEADEKELASVNEKIAEILDKLQQVVTASEEIGRAKSFYLNQGIDTEISNGVNEVARLRSTLIGTLPMLSKIRDLQQELGEIVSKNDKNAQLTYLIEKLNDAVVHYTATATKQGPYTITQGRITKLETLKSARATTLAELSTDIKSTDKEIGLLQRGHCPECGTDFKDAAHQEKLEKRIAHREECFTKVKTLTDKNAQVARISATLSARLQQYNFENDKQALMKFLGILKGSVLFNELVTLTNINLPTLKQAVVTITAAKVEVKDHQLISTELAAVQDELKSSEDANRIVESHISNHELKMKMAAVQKVQLPEGYTPKHKKETISAAQEKIQALHEQGSQKLAEYRKTAETLQTQVNTRKGSLGMLTDIQEVPASTTDPQQVLAELKQHLIEVEREITNLDVEISTIEQEIQRLISEHQGKLKSLTEFHASQKAKKEALETEIEAKIEAGRLQLYLEELLSEDNFKRFTISTFIPALNHTIKLISNEFNFPIKCEFDDDFQPRISRYGKPCSLKSISTGQRKILDVVVVLSVTALIVAKYPEINCVFYDEVFSNLSVANTAMMLDQIKRVCCLQHNLTVILVNHAFISQDYFDNIIEVTNDGTFSDLTVRQLTERPELASVSKEEALDIAVTLAAK